VKPKHHIVLFFARALVGLIVIICLNPFQVRASSAFQSWYIELITFTDRSEAQAFITRLAQKDFRADMVTVDVAGMVRYRTQSGLFHSVEDARHYRDRLKNNTNLHDNHLLIRGVAASAHRQWVIELLRFADQRQAAAFIARLHKKGFEAVITPVDVAGQTLFQAQIPKLSGIEYAKAVREHLKQRTNIADTHLTIIWPFVSTPTAQLQVQETQASVPEQTQMVPGVLTPSVVPVQQQVVPVKAPPTASVPDSRPRQPAQSRLMDSILPGWHIFGSNTIRTDVYHSKGNKNASPYRFSRMHSYDELNLNLDRVFSPWNHVAGQLSGLLYNDSKYRSPFPGMVLERINLRQDNGAFFIPYRAEVGDFFAFQSYRTIQRSLKGGRIEFQPQWGPPGLHQSIEFFGGSSTPAWDTFQYKDGGSQ